MLILQIIKRLLSNKYFNQKSLAVLVMALLVLLIFYFIQQSTNQSIESKEIIKKIERKIVPGRNIFYNEKLFTTALDSAKDIKPIFPRPRVVVVPHHLLAAEIISGVLAGSKSAAVRTIFIIGPNHDDKNASTIATAPLEWQTLLGQVITEDSLVNKFLSDFHLQPVTEAFLNEHSVGAIVPFVRYYFPQATVVPIILNSKTQMSDIQDIGQWLNNNLDEQSLIIISTDFSHYLSEEMAEKNDKITEQLILKQKVEAIMKLNNGFVDSPPSLITGLLFAKAKGLAPKIIYHANVNDFTEQPSQETTSYFGIIFN